VQGVSLSEAAVRRVLKAHHLNLGPTHRVVRSLKGRRFAYETTSLFSSEPDVGGYIVGLRENGRLISKGLIKVRTRGSRVEGTLVPILSKTILKPETFTLKPPRKGKEGINRKKPADDATFSSGWFGAAIKFSESETTTLWRTVGIAGITAGAVGIMIMKWTPLPYVGWVIAIAAMFAILTAATIAFEDAIGGYRGVYYAYTWWTGWMWWAPNSIGVPWQY